MTFVFGIVEHTEPYADVYGDLLAHLRTTFSGVESGIQSDAWIWILRDGVKVAVDTFYATQFEVSADSDHALVRDVIAAIQSRFPIRRYDPPIER